MPLNGTKFCLLRLLILAVPLCLADGVIAQQEPTQRDTLAIYGKIRKFAYKTKFTKMIYHAVFVDPAPQKYEKKPLSDKQTKSDPNAAFKGKIIRNVTIEVYDPFGFSVNDTTQREINPFQ